MITHWNLGRETRVEFALIVVVNNDNGKEYLGCERWTSQDGPALYFLNGVKILGNPEQEEFTVTIKDSDGDILKPFFQDEEVQKFSSPKVLFVEIDDLHEKTRNTFKVFRTGDGNNGKQLFVKRNFGDLANDFTRREEVVKFAETFKKALKPKGGGKKKRIEDPLARKSRASYKLRKQKLCTN